MCRPSLHRGDDGGEVVVQQNQIRRFARDVGAAPAHGHADIGALQGGSVVHAVAGHRHEFPLLLERFHDTQLLRRIDAGVHARPPDVLLQFAPPASPPAPDR